MKPVISVLIPCYNEQEVLEATFARLDAVMRGLSEPYELLFINDGSRDRTTEMLRELAAAHREVRALHFARNFGQEAALSAGLDAAEGDAVVIIDADLQDPPEIIPEMIRKWREEGFDVVYGKRRTREGETAFKKKTSYWFYRIQNMLVDIRIPEDTGHFRLVSRRAVDAVLSMPEHNRYLRGLFSWVGFKQGEVLFDRDKRFAGETKYPLMKMLRLALDGVISFSSKPMEWMAMGGAALGGVGVLWFVILFVRWIFGVRYQNTTAPLLFLFTGLMVGCMGVLGAYIARIYDEARGRPLYIVAERNGYESEQSAK